MPTGHTSGGGDTLRGQPSWPAGDGGQEPASAGPSRPWRCPTDTRGRQRPRLELTRPADPAWCQRRRRECQSSSFASRIHVADFPAPRAVFARHPPRHVSGSLLFPCYFTTPIPCSRQALPEGYFTPSSWLGGVLSHIACRATRPGMCPTVSTWWAGPGWRGPSGSLGDSGHPGQALQA